MAAGYHKNNEGFFTCTFCRKPFEQLRDVIAHEKVHITLALTHSTQKLPWSEAGPGDSDGVKAPRVSSKRAASSKGSSLKAKSQKAPMRNSASTNGIDVLDGSGLGNSASSISDASGSIPMDFRSLVQIGHAKLGVSNKATPSSSQEAIRCASCHVTFPNRPELYRHHSGSCKKASTRTLSNYCSVCELVFVNPAVFKTHMVTCHPSKEQQIGGLQMKIVERGGRKIRVVDCESYASGAGARGRPSGRPRGSTKKTWRRGSASRQGNGGNRIGMESHGGTSKTNDGNSKRATIADGTFATDPLNSVTDTAHDDDSLEPMDYYGTAEPFDDDDDDDEMLHNDAEVVPPNVILEAVHCDDDDTSDEPDDAFEPLDDDTLEPLEHDTFAPLGDYTTVPLQLLEGDTLEPLEDNNLAQLQDTGTLEPVDETNKLPGSDDEPSLVEIKEEYQCKNCQISFPDEFEYECHMDAGYHKNAEGFYSCKFCQQNFQKIARLVDHERRHITREGRPEADALIMPEIKIEEIDRYYCVFGCNPPLEKTFASRESLWYHAMNDHRDASNRCSLCKMDFPTWNVANAHIEDKHRIAMESAAQGDHQGTVVEAAGPSSSPQKEYQCVFGCKYVAFPSLDDLRSHASTRHRYFQRVCCCCNFIFGTTADVLQHVEEVHVIDRNDNVLGTMSTRITMIRQQPYQKGKPSVPEQFLCTMGCEMKMFRLESEMRTHAAEDHPGCTECKLCDMIFFASVEQLMQHIATCHKMKCMFPIPDVGADGGDQNAKDASTSTSDVVEGMDVEGTSSTSSRDVRSGDQNVKEFATSASTSTSNVVEGMDVEDTSTSSSKDIPQASQREAVQTPSSSSSSQSKFRVEHHYLCTYGCQMLTLRNTSDLNDHMRSTHGGTAALNTCVVCGMEDTTVKHIVEFHTVKVCRPIKVVEKLLCTYGCEMATFQGVAELEEHVKNAHEGRKYNTCVVCGLENMTIEHIIDFHKTKVCT